MDGIWVAVCVGGGGGVRDTHDSGWDGKAPDLLEVIVDLPHPVGVLQPQDLQYVLAAAYFVQVVLNLLDFVVKRAVAVRRAGLPLYMGGNLGESVAQMGHCNAFMPSSPG